MSVSPKGRADFFSPGEWNVACYECGRKRKATYMKRHWQGYYVCPEHWEARHPQDFVRSVPDNPTPPYVQDQQDVFVIACTWEGRQGVADFGVADCAIADFHAPDFTSGTFDPTAGNALDRFILDQSVLG